jgi:hypothetical protein
MDFYKISTCLQTGKIPSFGEKSSISTQMYKKIVRLLRLLDFK